VLQLGFDSGENFANFYAGDELDFDGPIPDDSDLRFDANQRFVHYAELENGAYDKEAVPEGW